MTQVFLVNEKSGKRFKVVDLDTEKNTITLKGEIALFTEPFNKPLFKQCGYKLVQEEDDGVQA